MTDDKTPPEYYGVHKSLQTLSKMVQSDTPESILLSMSKIYGGCNIVIEDIDQFEERLEP